MRAFTINDRARCTAHNRKQKHESEVVEFNSWGRQKVEYEIPVYTRQTRGTEQMSSVQNRSRTRFPCIEHKKSLLFAWFMVPLLHKEKMWQTRWGIKFTILSSCIPEPILCEVSQQMVDLAAKLALAIWDDDKLKGMQEIRECCAHQSNSACCIEE